MDISDFCREIETFLRRKNDGHLIRIVGPSFSVVGGWAERGIPLKVVFEGIDRYFERYYRKGPRRRPVKIDFCEADVLDVFDEWRRAIGAVGLGELAPAVGESRRSLPDHLERVVIRLTSARASGTLGDDADATIDRLSAELDAARAKPGGLRGAARSETLTRLAALDRELLQSARARMDPADLSGLAREADEELAPFRAGMAGDAYARAHEAAVERLVRLRMQLPTIAFD